MIEAEGVAELVGSQQPSHRTGVIELAVEHHRGGDDRAVPPCPAPAKPDGVREMAHAAKAADDNLIRPHDGRARTGGNHLVLDGGELLERAGR